MKKTVIILIALSASALAGFAQPQDVSNRVPSGRNDFSNTPFLSGTLFSEPLQVTGFNPASGFSTPGISLANSRNVAAAATSTEEGAFPKGSFGVNAGIGVGDVYWGTGYGTSSGVAPTAILEYAVTDKLGIGNIGAGLIVSYASTKYNDGSNTYTYSATLVGLRGLYHFMINNDKVGNKLDPYGGVLLGYVITNNPDITGAYSALTGKSSGFIPGVFAGAHYFFGPVFGVYAELGYEALFVFNFGVSFKFH